MVEVLLDIVTRVLEALGPHIVRKHVDEWAAAKAVSDEAFRQEFGHYPPERK